MNDAVAGKNHEAAQAALDHMVKWGLDPKPENFTVWLTYFAGSTPQLNQTVDILLSNGQGLDNQISDELYCRFFDGSSATLRNLMSNIEDSVSRAICTLDDAGKGARDYQTFLGDSAVSLSKEQEVVRIREIVRRVLSDTKMMIERNNLLEKQLSRSTAEIGELRRQIDDAGKASLTDPLTDIGNRKMFDQHLKKMMSEAMEHGSDLSVILLDIDHFKAFNDNYGHQFGDLVLKLVARMLHDGIRASDLAARYGGEEFALLLPDTRMEDAAAIAEMLCRRIATRRIIKKDTKQALGNVTLSAGVTAYEFGESWMSLVARADSALYQAKSAGRNRVIALNSADWVESHEREFEPAVEEIHA